MINAFYKNISILYYNSSYKELLFPHCLNYSLLEPTTPQMEKLSCLYYRKLLFHYLRVR